MSDLVFGIDWLDKNFAPSLKLNPLIMIAGHPGVGKTTLACTMCYANANNGNKCLYITFHEDRDKLFHVMSNLGLNLSDVESKGLLKFVKIPTSSSPEFIGGLITDLIKEFDPKVVIVDSITPLLISVGTREKRRELIQNFLYELPKNFNGALVIIAELVGDRKDEELGDMYFIADIVLILRVIIERGLTSRVMEVKKVRGCDVRLGEVRYSISSGVGIQLFPKTLLEEIPPDARELKLPCKVLEKSMDHLHLGMSVYITYPPDDRCLETFLFLTGLLMENNLRCLYITYNRPPGAVREQIIRVLRRYGISKEVADKIVENYYTIVSVNPYLYDLDTLLVKLLTLVEEAKTANVIVFDDISLVSMAYGKEDYLRAVYDNINFLRLERKLNVRIGSYINDENYRLNCMVSDVIVNIMTRYDDSLKYKSIVHLWRRGMRHTVLTDEELARCFEEITELIKEKSSNL
ncbi:MAG: ATPase domain-containing protein [Sulfolobales archaeon]